MKGSKMKNNLLEGLNDEQRIAVESIEGPIQVISIAGSGKTKVLTSRTANMVNNHKINPDNILIATFTKKAADEMRERLTSLMNKNDIDRLMLGTFHSIGYKILRSEYTIMNHKLKGATLLQGNAAIWLMEEAIKNVVGKKELDSGAYEPGIILAKIANYKMDLKTADDILLICNLQGDNLDDYEENVLKIYREYEKLKDQKCLLDFDDMLFKTYKLFVENPKVLQKYQNQIQYLLIDEAQDNNMAQYELVKMLAEPQNNVFIVGDDDQSIYSFRGAKPEEFIGFEKSFENVNKISLIYNYRSTQAILDAADNLISYNKNRIAKSLVSGFNPEKTVLPSFIQTDDEEQEGIVIADKILEFSDSKRFKDMAIIYRTNSQSRALEDALLQNSIPYTILNGTSFYERAEIKDMIAYLNLAYNNNDDKSLERIINKPSRYIGKVFMNNLKQTAKAKKCSLFEALPYVEASNGVKNNVKSFISKINKVSDELSTGKNVGQIISDLIESIEYRSYLSSNEENEKDNSKIENLDALCTAADKYDNCKDFLDFIKQMTSKVKKENSDAVKLMTIHKSKGLEFPIVFLAGMSDEVLPNKRATMENPVAGLEEERRLAYVGITRAKEYLLVTSPEYYQGKYKGISKFIQEAKLEEAENYLNKDDETDNLIES